MNRKPIFDAVRNMLGRGFTQAEIDALDLACNHAEAGLPAGLAPKKSTAAPPPTSGKVLGAAGTRLIQKWEGCERRQANGTFNAYPDPGSRNGDPWTIGWGSTGPDVKQGVNWTQAQCDARFGQDMQRYVDGVARAIGNAPTTPNQFDALVSFHYNTGAIGKANLAKKHINGDYPGAAKEFAKWIFNDGKPMNGLKNRRAEEAQLYAKP